ncbi:MAG: hypothetical protein ACK528_05260 [Alphaproteobacteria bacterium]
MSRRCPPLEVAAEILRRAGETEAVTHLAVVRQKLRESGKKGALKGADAAEVLERTVAALCALKAIGTDGPLSSISAKCAAIRGELNDRSR